MEFFLDAWPVLALPLGWLWWMLRANTTSIKEIERRSADSIKELEKSFHDYRVYVSEVLLNTKIEKAIKPIRDHLVLIEQKIDRK